MSWVHGTRVLALSWIVASVGCTRGGRAAGPVDAGQAAGGVRLTFGDAAPAVGASWRRVFSLQTTLPVRRDDGLVPLVQRQARAATVTVVALDAGLSQVRVAYDADGGAGPGWDDVAGRSFDVLRTADGPVVWPVDPRHPQAVQSLLLGDTLDVQPDPAFRAALPSGAVAVGARVPSVERYLRPLVEGAFGGRAGDLAVTLTRADAAAVDFALSVPLRVAFEEQLLSTTLSGTLQVRPADSRILKLGLEGFLTVLGPAGPTPFPGVFSLELSVTPAR